MGHGDVLPHRVIPITQRDVPPRNEGGRKTGDHHPVKLCMSLTGWKPLPEVNQQSGDCWHRLAECVHTVTWLMESESESVGAYTPTTAPELGWLGI